jgi:hypothetical protein
MRNAQHWLFQAPQSGAKVAQQDITALTNLAAGLIAFQKAYLTTHGEKGSVTNLLSMINEAIRHNVDIIERRLVEKGDYS